jgi:ssDNA-binding Zn-finger/Zn-ribbon topoisomerase 1
MGTAVNSATCNECKAEFGVVLEWKNKADAIEEIAKTNCPECQSANWSFTDEMGQ